MTRPLEMAALGLVAVFMTTQAQAARHQHPAYAEAYMAISPFGEVSTRHARIAPTIDEPPAVSTGGPVGGLPDRN